VPACTPDMQQNSREVIFTGDWSYILCHIFRPHHSLIRNSGLLLHRE